MGEEVGTRSLPAGDFADVYEREVLSVLRFLRNVVDGDADAEDLCADVFVNAWRAWPRFSGGPAGARAWLFRIARNVAVDAHRRGAGARLLPLDQPGLGLRAADETSAEMMSIRAALSRLRLADRELLAMRAAGLSYEEMAAIRGGRGDATKVAWHRAAQRLHELLEAE